MAKGEYTDVVKAMKAATTPQEIFESWTTQAEGTSPENNKKIFGMWAERKPEMIEVFAKNILWRAVDHDILDPKTRTLVTLTAALALGSMEGALAQCANAKGAGATEEEMMECAYLVSYQAAKGKMAFTGEALEKAFKATANVKPLKKKA